jgi:hypothetical protein
MPDYFGSSGGGMREVDFGDRTKKILENSAGTGKAERTASPSV